MDLEDDFWEPEREAPSRPPDPAVESAGARIRQIYQEKPKAVFFVRQLELLLEREFFHWVTDFAIRDLYESGFLKDEYMPLNLESTRLRFLFRPSHRARRRQMKQTVALVRRYSEPTFAKACGRYAQELFLAALLRRGFRLEAENARSFRGLEWRETDHDLDFIISDAGICYGCEVKNRLEYISREELSIKLKMCAFLGLRPVFIMRSSPKTYNFQVVEAGGYAWIFASQIYPPGHESLASAVTGVLGLPALCSYGIPSGMVERFEKFHKRIAGL
jgi:hypothetical protein